ncbi:MAG: type II CAAX endopeptidase family protein [Flavobacteriaceae bacterium]|nr:type II CAAX endopeptidase family protein [Flavobacteriaceae bacterium]
MENIQHYLDFAFKGKKGILRYLLGAFLIIIISLFLGQMFSVVGVLLIKSDSPAAEIAITNFFGFILSFLLIPVIVALLHRRPWWSVAMPAPKVNGAAFLVGFLSGLIVQSGSFLVSYFVHPENITYVGVDWGSWVPMLFLYLIVFFVQVSTEEMVYRGYLAQMMYRFSKSPFLVLLIPSIIFSLPHYGNIKGSSGILALLPYIFMGLMYAWMAYRSGSLWMGIGAHLVNNWFITLFVGSKAE